MSEILRQLVRIEKTRCHYPSQINNGSVKTTQRSRTIPDWIRFSIPGGGQYAKVKRELSRGSLHTVCIEAKCPNVGECFCAGQATFLVMGDTCTRHCGYCAVNHGTPQPLDPDEPSRIADAVNELELRYAVITSVTRDDLADGGAAHLSTCVREIRAVRSDCLIELLVPDFRNVQGDAAAILVKSKPDCLNHNIEVVASLFSTLRPEGDYQISLRLLNSFAQSGIAVKSGLMIGFGESTDEIIQTLRDLRDAGCQCVTIGQYLQSRKDGFPVKKFYHPDEFAEITKEGNDLGIIKMLAGPLVRSSYHAEQLFGSADRSSIK
jgi:lipoic acid synthetase